MIEEWCGVSAGRLIPLCIVPLWDPELAAAEIRRNAERGCRAIAFSEQPAALGLPSIHDRARHWDPLLAACDETGTVICMHLGSSSRMPNTSRDAPPGVTMALTFANSQSSLVDWLLSGVLARFPNIRIAYSEGQAGWIPFVLERLDHVFLRSRSWAGLDPSIVEPPSAYYRGRVFSCVFDDDFGISSRDVIGVDQITFETDYPHQDSTWPDSVSVVRRMADVVSPADLRRIVRDNAIDLFALDGLRTAAPK
jgi:predicted TIM-barrel fold metal-dependent hydrolase